MNSKEIKTNNKVLTFLGPSAKVIPLHGSFISPNSHKVVYLFIVEPELKLLHQPFQAVMCLVGKFSADSKAECQCHTRAV